MYYQHDKTSSDVDSGAGISAVWSSCGIIIAFTSEPPSLFEQALEISSRTIKPALLSIL
jgi:hypothetical protein